MTFFLVVEIGQTGIINQVRWCHTLSEAKDIAYDMIQSNVLKCNMVDALDQLERHGNYFTDNGYSVQIVRPEQEYQSATTPATT